MWENETVKNIHWLVLGVIYTTFFLWYSNLSGPLTSEEVEAYLSKSSGDFNNSELFREFLENDDGKAFYMVNYLDLNENPFGHGCLETEKLFDPDKVYEGEDNPTILLSPCSLIG